MNSEARGATWGCTTGGTGSCWTISHLCWYWQPWGKMALIVKAFALSIWKLTLDLGKHMRNWLLIRIWRVFSLEFNKNYNRICSSFAALPGLWYRGQHSVVETVRCFKVSCSLFPQNVSSFPNTLLSAHAIPSAFSELLFTRNYLPFKTQPNCNFWYEAFLDSLCHMIQSLYLSPVPCPNKHLLKTLLFPTPTPA